MAKQFPPLIVARQPRQIGGDWAGSRSWFGGNPRLGSCAWPRGKETGKPLTFMAQLDLKVVAAQTGGGLPSSGSLAFFIGGEDPLECAVLHVPAGQHGPTAPPESAPAAYDPVVHEVFPHGVDEYGPPFFPYWPVTITALDVGADADEAHLTAAVDRHFKRRKYFLSAYSACKELGEAAPPYWWHSAQHLASCLERARNSAPSRRDAMQSRLPALNDDLSRVRRETKGFFFGRGRGSDDRLTRAEDNLRRATEELEAFDGLLADYIEYTKLVAAWSSRKPPFERMDDADEARLRDLYVLGRNEFKVFTSFFLPSSIDDIVSKTLLALLTAEDEAAYASIPEPLRLLVNERYLLPTESWHQMFGQGVDIQNSAVPENEGNVMLLQLAYDDMLHWRFGDVGAFQFWIPPDALTRGEWDDVRLTFEAH